MATDDLSRSAFYPGKRFAGVRMQQGRVLTDDDFNEQEQINHEDKRLSTLDIVGKAGSPDNGLFISDAGVNENGINFTINEGTFYAGGLRIAVTDDQYFQLQDDWLQKAVNPAPDGERYDMVYVEVWQQSVSAVEDSELYEKALGGPDTTTRRRTMFRVKMLADVDTNNCGEAWQLVKAGIESSLGGEFVDNYHLKSDADLQVGYVTNGESENLCTPSVLAGYLGADNQAIRVQLVDENHLTWGFDNGAPLYRVSLEDAASDRQTIKLLTDPKDEAHWPQSGQIVEILPWSAVLENGEKLAEETSPGHFSRLSASYNPDTGEITLSTSVPDGFGEQWESRDDADDLRTTRFGTEELDSEHGYFFMRAWDRGADHDSDVNIPIPASGEVELLKTGLKISLEGDYPLPGDHWVIAVRPHTPDQVVPWELEVTREADGYQRFYAPLAIIHWRPNQFPFIYDCRKRFRPLIDQDGCCSYTVGDGVNSEGDFNSLEQAIVHLPDDGGRICLLAGVHHANLQMQGLKNIRITGCGRQTIVHPNMDADKAPIIAMDACHNIVIDDITFNTMTGTAIEIKDDIAHQKQSSSIHIKNNHILALVHAINVEVSNKIAGKNDIRIVGNEIGMWDREEGEPAIFSDADGVLIKDNLIKVIPAPAQGDPSDPRDPDDHTGTIFELCEDLLFYYQNPVWMLQMTWSAISYLQVAWGFFLIEYKAHGGIQIGGGSEDVKIDNNKIIGGYGNGITLGHVPRIQGDDWFHKKVLYDHLSNNEMGHMETNYVSHLYELAIENNTITSMGRSGIGVTGFFNTRKIGLMVGIEDVTIYRNSITQCAMQIPTEKPEDMLDEFGFGGVVLASCENVMIQENRIENNGPSQKEPVCGVLILYGEKIDVSNNRILNNGPLVAQATNDLDRGLRGGVVVAMGFRQFIMQLFQGKNKYVPDGIPAIKIHNNIITQPLGQALFLMAYGPISVIGNHLTSQGADLRVNPLSVIAGAVLIIDLGVSQDLLPFLALVAYKLIATGNINKLTMARRTDRFTEVDYGFVDMDYSYLPSGDVLFSNNQTTLDLRDLDSIFVFSAQLIVSLDDVAYNSNQSECYSQVNYRLLTNAGIIGASVRANDNRFQEGYSTNVASLLSLGFMNTAATNQATHCIFPVGAPAFTLNVGNSILIDVGCPKSHIRIAKYMGVREITSIQGEKIAVSDLQEGVDNA